MSTSGAQGAPEQNPQAGPPGRVRGRKRRFAKLWTRRLTALAIAVLAGVLVTLFTVDIGRAFDLKQLAESRGSKFIGRPLHIGKLSAYLTPGAFELDDVVIDGLTPDASPFLTAKRITIRLPWWTLFSRRFEIAEVRMTDWRMHIEQWSDGRHNFPHFSLPGGGAGPSLFTKTVGAVYADRGEFIYEDHGTPWSVDARNLSVDLVHAPNLLATLGSQYVGRARFSGGTVQIQDFLPMSASLGASFVLDKGLVKLHRIDLVTDGAVSHVTGVVDLSHWPAQTYQVDSRLDFHRMRDIFFARESWRLAGEGHFLGTFQLYRGGRELKGAFSSPVATLNDLAFSKLQGSLDWLPRTFAVSDATANLMAGRAAFSYGVDGFGTPGGAAARFKATYADLDLGQVGEYFGVHFVTMAGAASGSASLTWRNGHFADTFSADAATQAVPPSGHPVADRALPQLGVIVLPEEPFNDHKAVGSLAVGADLHYQVSREGIDFAPSWVATPATYVAFSGHVGPTGGDLRLPVQVTSKDWAASDRLLAAVLTARHAATKAIDVGGRGTFDGLLTESFSDLHATGRFVGDQLWAFGVRWPQAVGDLQIADRFVMVTHGVVSSGDSHIDIDGRFSIGSNPPDDELKGKFTVDHWPLTDFKTAFHMTTWPVDGTASAELDLHGPYLRPVGTGTLRIDQGSAWQEPFELATGTLVFEGRDLLIRPAELTKGNGRVQGTALISWDDTYSFDARGDHVALESLHNFKVPAAPLTGELDFHVSGAGNFQAPTYTFEGHVADLYAGDEGVGDVTGTIVVQGTDLTLTSLNVEGRVQATGKGRMSTVKPYPADLTLTATDASIDPFLKFVMTSPPQLFRAVVSAGVHVVGPLGNPAQLSVETNITSAALELFDYNLQNDGPVHLTFVNDALTIDRLNLRGQNTKLAVSGSVSRSAGTCDLLADGDADLAMLQAFKGFGDLRLGGSATLKARLVGELSHPQFSGEATIHDGRLRFFSSRSLDAITGSITFENGDLNFDHLTAKMGGGDVKFGGTLRFDGLHPVEYQLTASGRNVQLRYPAGFETTATATLSMTGPVAKPTLGGEVDVTRVHYLRPLAADASLIGGLAAAGGTSDASAGSAPSDQTDLSIAYDIRVRARSLAFFDTKDLTLYGGTDDLTIRGTVSQPVVTGRINLDRGEFFFNGNRIRLVTGSIDFANPLRTEPVFDIQAATQVHVQQLTYNITGHLTSGGVDLTCGAGTECTGNTKLGVSFTSDPILSDTDIVTLLLGGTNDPNSVEVRTLESPQQAQSQLVQTMAAQLLTAPLSSRVGDIVGTFTPFDTFQFVPLLGLDPTVGSGTTTSARVTLGKAVSSKVYLTYSRDVTNAMELYLLEYTENDRVSWVLSRNEDHTFALDFRIRHIF